MDVKLFKFNVDAVTAAILIRKTTDNGGNNEFWEEIRRRSPSPLPPPSVVSDFSPKIFSKWIKVFCDGRRKSWKRNNEKKRTKTRPERRMRKIFHPLFLSRAFAPQIKRIHFISLKIKMKEIGVGGRGEGEVRKERRGRKIKRCKNSFRKIFT